MTSLHLRAGLASPGDYDVSVDPSSAGWGYASLRVLSLTPGSSHHLTTGDSEWIVLPLTGGCTVLVGEGEVFELAGRDSVFHAVSDFAYLPRDAQVSVTSEGGGRFALAGARCERHLPARYGPAWGVPVELRGAGCATRQVNNFAAADVFAADRLIAVEVLTPGGNWSSYPPHKHDEHREGIESELEEIYYFELAGGQEAMGYQRVYPSARYGHAEVLAEVRGGDCVLVPGGWHGPSMAAPGYDMYYLNVMAGPGPERAWLTCDDPTHAWVRGGWRGQSLDPRLPFYTSRTPNGISTPPPPSTDPPAERG